jgi:hypothetical protein
MNVPVCSLNSGDKRALAKRVGDDLLHHVGRKPYYSVAEVKAANRRQKVDIDAACWAHALFNSHADFDRYHAEVGETCDYSAMKSEMLEAVSVAGDASWFDLDLSWIDFPDVDWTIFDFIDF